MPSRGRLILDGAHPGAWNMAVDEALFEAAADHPETGPTLRWYRWSEPTLSLGYFQTLASVPEPLRSLPCVRRSSGGGAILHDREWTYSLTLPRPLWSGVGGRQRIVEFHQLLIEALTDVAPLSLHRGNGGRPDEPFLCFERRSAGDIVVGASKVVGSAQRCRHGALLQHGSILLARSAYAPELAGLADLTGRDEIAIRWDRIHERLASAWDLEWAVSALTRHEAARARHWLVHRYAAWSWTQRR